MTFNFWFRTAAVSIRGWYFSSAVLISPCHGSRFSNRVELTTDCFVSLIRAILCYYYFTSCLIERVFYFCFLYVENSQEGTGAQSKLCGRDLFERGWRRMSAGLWPDWPPFPAVFISLALWLEMTQIHTRTQLYTYEKGQLWKMCSFLFFNSQKIKARPFFFFPNSSACMINGCNFTSEHKQSQVLPSAAGRSLWAAAPSPLLAPPNEDSSEVTSSHIGGSDFSPCIHVLNAPPGMI